MRVFFLLLPLIGSTYVKAQPPMPFPQNAEWSINMVTMGEYAGYGSYGILGDTIINGENYKSMGFSTMAIFDPFTASYHSALRDDGGRWYGIPAGDMSEYLLYDFTADIGDTVTVQNPFNSGGSIDPVQLIVVSIDTNEFEGPARRMWQLGSFSGWDEYWYEGIGSREGVFHHLTLMFDADHALVCFHENDSLIYQLAGFSNCEWATSVASQELDESLVLYPNPTSQRTTIQTLLKPEWLIVFDLHGSEIIKLHQQDHIDTAALPDGIYFVRMLDQQHEYHDGKLMIKH